MKRKREMSRPEETLILERVWEANRGKTRVRPFAIRQPAGNVMVTELLDVFQATNDPIIGAALMRLTDLGLDEADYRTKLNAMLRETMLSDEEALCVSGVAHELKDLGCSVERACQRVAAALGVDSEGDFEAAVKTVRRVWEKTMARTELGKRGRGRA